jgi:prepilin-type N-terminal cleavage/methylation domain-containing protein
MIMKKTVQKTIRQHGFSLLELMISMAVMLVILGAAFRYVAVATRRSAAEETKMDLTQQAREFVDEFERDLHQVGYPGCRLLAGSGGGYNCDTPYQTTVYSNNKLAAGLVKVTSYQVILEGDVDGDGVVDSVQYRLVDSNGNDPVNGSTCPCAIQRSQLSKLNADPVSGQSAPVWSQELQNIVNSGNPGAGSVYGNGLPIAGNTMWGQSNNSYYAAVTTFKDFPVFTAYDQNGQIITLPLRIDTNGPAVMANIKSLRLTINLLANANNGYDQQTHIRPVMTLVGNGRIANCPATQAGNCN